MNILILGAGGFIGSHLTEGLIARTAHDVVGFDLVDDKLQTLPGRERLRMYRGDVRQERDLVARLVSEADLVVDLIAHANPALYVLHPLDVFQLNFQENLRIAELCVAVGKRLIQFSSCEVYGKTASASHPAHLKDPEDPALATFSEDGSDLVLGPVARHRWIYASAKQLLERVLHAYGLEGRLSYTIVRPFNFIGPRIDYLPGGEDGNPRVFSHFMAALIAGGDMPLVDGGHHRRSYTYIDDAIDCILRMVENPGGACHNQIFNVGNPANELSIRELAQRMRQIWQARWQRPGAPLSELVEVSGVEFYGEGYEDSDRRIPDIAKDRSLLGWEPRFDLQATLEHSMAYYAEPE